jgi:hypothetical protein
MFSRLQNWLRGNPRQRLTKGAAKEIAHELNRPILESLHNPPPGFVSTRHFRPDDVAARIRRIPWFAHCGDPLSVNLSMPVRRCLNWSEAVAPCGSDDWGAIELEAQNQLTVWLHWNAPQDYQRWNDLVVDFKDTILRPVIEPAVRDYSQRHGLGDSVLHSVYWDMLGALMENHYLHTGHQVFFFLELLELYEAGHFPCGWTGQWPQGELHVL